MPDSKYAQIERERRFLVRDLPRDEPSARRAITDLYVEGTRVRLRRSVGVVDGQDEVLQKLTQKIPDSVPVGGRRGSITTMYLSDPEYERMAKLPGRRLTKHRLSFPPMGVDVFHEPLEGLMIAEAEFSDDDEMLKFVAPSWCEEEITEHFGFTGGNLARIAALDGTAAADALAELLRSIEPPNTVTSRGPSA
jgi:CYTH domain-containing protein